MVHGTQSLQQLTRRFVVGVLGDEFAAEGFGEGGEGEALDGLLRGGEAGFDPVGEGEQIFASADDFVMFGEWGEDFRQLPGFQEVSDRIFREIALREHPEAEELPIGQQMGEVAVQGCTGFHGARRFPREPGVRRAVGVVINGKINLLGSEID